MNIVVSFFIDSYQDTNRNREKYKYISLSPYDRVMVKQVDSFKDLCTAELVATCEDTASSAWVGVEQKMHLISEKFEDISNSKLVIPTDSEENCMIICDGVKYNFYCFVTLYYSNFFKALQKLQFDMQKTDAKHYFENVIKEGIAKSINNDNCKASFFKSIGSEDIVILLLSDSMKELVTIVDKIMTVKVQRDKDIIEDPFAEACVFAGLNKTNGWGASTENDTNDVEMVVKLNLKTNNCHETIRKICENSSIDTNKFTYKKMLSKKCTVELYFPEGTISYSEFGDSGVFNGNSSVYSEYILKSRTYFLNECTNGEGVFINLRDCQLPENIDLGYGKVVETSNQNTKSGSGKDVENSNQNSVANFLIKEYRRMCEMPRFYSWKQLLQNQMECIQKILSNLSDKSTGNHMLNDVQRSLFHINQACSPVSEVPYHNYFYAGSFNNLLMSYYGIIQQILDLSSVFSHGEGTNQDKIVFSICLNSSSKIESSMFKDANGENTFVVFYLPYDSLWDYSHNIKLLIHEVFHYIAPFDREKRAKYLLDIAFKDILYSIFQLAFYEKIKKHVSSVDISQLEKVISSWLEFIVETYIKEKKNDELYFCVRKIIPNFSTCSIPDQLVGFKRYGYSEIVFRESLEIIVKLIKNTYPLFFDKKKNDELPSNAIDEVRRCISSSYLRSLFVVDNLEMKYVAQLTFDKFAIDMGVVITAAKEAFCDIWAIDILNISIHDYIGYILEKLINDKNYTTVNNYIFNSSREITPDSMMLRLNLLLDFILSDGVNTEDELLKRFNSTTSDMESAYKDDKKILELFQKIREEYDEYRQKKSYLRDDFSRLAFDGQQTMLKCILKDKKINDAAKELRKIYNHNLVEDVYYEDLLYLMHKAQPSSSQDIEAQRCKKSSKKCCFEVNDCVILKETEKSYHGYFVRNVGDYIRVVNNILKVKNNRYLWYRGVCNEHYSLLPSIFRGFNEKLPLYVNQSNVVKHAFLQTKSMVDIWNMPVEQQMALLQHYGGKTNLLDFSMDMLIALYFALCPDGEKDRERIDNGEFQPVVYVFDPINFCNVTRILRDESIDSCLRYDILPYEFDIDCNDFIMSRYFLSNTSFDALVEHTEKYVENYVPNDRCNEFPVPIIIRQSNARIIAQDGTFVAFSLFSKPTCGTDEKRYSYIDLLNIRIRYYDFCSKYKVSCDYDFLHLIYIDKTTVSRMRNELKSMNIGSYKVYPELRNLISEGTQKYLDNAQKANGAINAQKTGGIII